MCDGLGLRCATCGFGFCGVGFWIGLFCFIGGFGACNVFGDLGWVV